MRIDIEEIVYITARRNLWNSTDFEKIEFYKNGKRLIIPEDRRKTFKETGLNNIDFITMGWWKEPSNEKFRQYDYGDNIRIIERDDGVCLIYHKDEEQYPDNQFVWDGVYRDNAKEAFEYLQKRYAKQIHTDK